MKVVLVLMLVALSAMAMPNKSSRAVASCDPDKCKLPSCRCSGVDIPGGLAPADTPQFVLFTFDDAVTPVNIDYYREAIYGRENPNGCKVSATFFVSHEYTDYSLVHELHANGQQIALHSISHQPLTSYWKNATLSQLLQEFADERTLISTFANIPEEDIKGIRMPFLQMAGNNQFNMLKQSGFLYDLSWVTQSYIEPGMWPYTTEYLSTQECLIGPCPDESYSGVWVIPMINWKDISGVVCAMVDACVDIPEDVEGLTNWMIREFERQYKGNRSPFGFYVHSAWFLVNDNHYLAYIAFMDYLQTLPDVFLVSGSQVIDWVKNPIPVSEMTPENEATICHETYPPICKPKNCQLMNGDVS